MDNFELKVSCFVSPDTFRTSLWYETIMGVFHFDLLHLAEQKVFTFLNLEQLELC